MRLPLPYNEPQWYIIDNSGNRVYDYDIHPSSACKNVFFTFLWACHGGDVIGSYYYWPGTGTAYGMPHAWRHSTQMNENGYTNPGGDGLFIGWNGSAPALISTRVVPNAGRDFE